MPSSTAAAAALDGHRRRPASARARRRWSFHATAGAVTAVHQMVELGYGTGIIGQSAAGLGPAIAASVTLDGGWMLLGRRQRLQPLLAFLAGAGVAVPLMHFLIWPWEWRRVPLLTTAEGLPEAVMPAYNAILYLWAGAALAGLVWETPPRQRWLALLGGGSVLAARPAIEAHFQWMGREAQRRPRWWNRAWQE